MVALVQAADGLPTRKAVEMQPDARSDAAGSGTVARRHFRGGLQTTFLKATWPLAGLTVTASGVSVGFLVPLLGWKWEWSALESIEEVRRPVSGSPGVRFVPRNGGSVIFWTFNPRGVLAAVEHAGGQVSLDAPATVWYGTGRRT
jgi:hypothetical protein